MVDLSIVMPCLNEAETRESCILKAKQSLACLKLNAGWRGAHHALSGLTLFIMNIAKINNLILKLSFERIINESQ
jgi:hypothetical protein